MASHAKENDIPSAPTDASMLYPEEDGKPMAASDRHRERLIRTLHILAAYFKEKNPGAYVSGDILMYYVEGNPRRVVSPDVLVTFGIGQKSRRTYRVWEEGKVPDFVMEFSSKSTYRNDLAEKLTLYASLGIPNYFLYDAEGLYLPSPLMGFRLVDGVYVPISSGADGGLHAPALGLDFHVSDAGLNIYDPVTGEWLRTPVESALARAAAETARAEREAVARQMETARAEREAVARQSAETEVARLREELDRLQAEK